MNYREKRLLVFAIFLISFSNVSWGDEVKLKDKAKDYWAQPPQNHAVKEKYVSEVLYSIPEVPDCPRFRSRFDLDGNLYFFCGTSIFVYDKTGKQTRKLEWNVPSDWATNPREFDVFVDEIGDVLALDGSKIFALDGINGTLENGWNDSGDGGWPGYFAFSNGVFYSWEDGKVLFVMKGHDPKNIRQKLFKRDYLGEKNNSPIQVRADGVVKKIPRVFKEGKDLEDVYGFDELVGIDDLGNVYANYSTQTESERYENGSELLFRKTRTYKFNKKMELLTYFDGIKDAQLNPKTQEFYYAEDEVVGAKKVISYFKWTLEK